MSDRFDPEAWPYPDDDEPANKASTNKQDDQDDYKSLDFDNPTTASNTQGYGDPYSDAPYSDVSYDDYGYKPAAKTEANAGYDAPSAGFGGRVAVDEDEDYGTTPARHGDDDFGTTGAYGQDDEDDDPYASGNDAAYDEDDAYGSDDYDDEDYDEDDDYDDREPKQGGGLARKLIGAGVVVALAGFAVFMFLTFTGGDDSDNVATAPTTEVTEAPSESPEDTSTDGSLLATEAAAPAEVVEGLNSALAAWGKFAVSGNLDEVRPYFAANGTQFRSFESEATSLQAAPPGGAPLNMTMTNPTTLRASDDSWIVQGPVSITRQGEQDQTLNWRIQMQETDGVWQVATVANAS